MNIKRTAVLALTALMLTALPALAEEDDYISVAVNGKALYLEQVPVIRNSSVLVPLRGIFESLGAKVKWDGPTKTVHAFTVDPENPTPDPNVANITIDLPISSPTATVNGSPMQLICPAMIINGATMVPLRFVSEAMGAKVKWYSEDRQVRVAQVGFESTLDMPDRDGDVQSTWAIGPGLPRIMVGGQAGLTKVLDPTCLKDDYIRTLDNYTTAKPTEAQRDAIYAALGIRKAALNHLCHRLINAYSKERKYQLQILALLGLVTSEDPTDLKVNTAQLVRTFLLNKLYNSDPKRSANDNNVIKRQALLALALMRVTSYATVNHVVTFFEKTDNNYILSPMPLFFSLHAEQIKAMPEYQSIYSRLAAINSMYTPEILETLKK